MYSILSFSRLFDGISPPVIEEILSRVPYTERHFGVGDVIAIQGSRYNHAIILVEGKVLAEATDVSKNNISVEHINAPAIVAPSYLFADNPSLPVTISAENSVVVLMIDREAFLTMLLENKLLNRNFLEIISSTNRFVSDKVVYLNYKTIKGKFANYILSLMERQQNGILRNTMTQREMAEMFGVTRPALARAIGELVDEGTIYVKGKSINVLFAEKLRHYAKN